MKRIRRRTFLAAVATQPFLLNACGGPGRRRTEEPRTLVDIHIHLLGTGDSGSGCKLSSRIRGGFLFKFLKGSLGLGQGGESVDAAFVRVLLDQLRNSGIDRGVLLAQDAVYDSRGRRDEERTHFCVPNDHLLEVTRRNPEWLVPCVSINPDRRDSIEELERCFARGARILKIHPPIQGVDPGDRKHRRFFARCAELKVLVMVHTGHEHSAPVIDKHLADPRRLELALEEGCTVVACHAGTGWPGEMPDFLPGFLEMVRRHDRLWGDTSVLGTRGRVRDVTRLLTERDVLPRLVHGSDFPFPSTPVAFSATLGLERALELQSEPNVIRRDYALKEALGIGRPAAERAHELISRAGVPRRQRPPQ